MRSHCTVTGHCLQVGDDLQLQLWDFPPIQTSPTWLRSMEWCCRMAHMHTQMSQVSSLFGVGALTALWVCGGLPEGLSPVFFVELLVVFSAFIFIRSQTIFYLLSSSAFLTDICIKWEHAGWNSLWWGNQLELKGAASWGFVLGSCTFPPI